MRRLLAASVIAAAVSSTAVLADDRSDCLEGTSQDLRIKACSEVLATNPNNAMAYYMRGAAYQSKGEVDRAISDYTVAIELNPYHAAAYESRARAYVGKGDYTHAVADVTMAGELARKGSAEPKKVIAEHSVAAATAAAPVAEPPAKRIAPAPQSAPQHAPPKMKAATVTPANPAAVTVAPANPAAAKAAAKQPAGNSWPAWVSPGRSEN
jgi:tetratricopeptide (TPR) repeat protein